MRQILKTWPQIERANFVSAVEEDALERVHDDRLVTSAVAYLGLPRKFLDQSVVLRESRWLVRRALVRSEHWRGMNDERLLTGLMQRCEASTTYKEVFKVVLEGSPDINQKHLFTAAVEGALREAGQNVEEYRRGLGAPIRQHSVPAVEPTVEPPAASTGDATALVSKPSADDELYCRMPPATVVSRALILSEQGEVLTSDSVPALLARRLKGNESFATKMRRISDKTASERDKLEYDNAVQSVTETLRGKHCDVPAYQKAANKLLSIMPASAEGHSAAEALQAATVWQIGYSFRGL